MNAQAKEGRRANQAKAMRLVKNDPHQKVDASSWKPNEALNADRKTGARPVRARIYKLGGKIQGDRADRHPGRAARASGGKVGTGPLSMANVPAENKSEFGSYHEGGYKRGGSPKAGQDMADMKKAMRTGHARGGSAYSKEAVDKEIRKDKRIGKGEASMIHRLLKGRSVTAKGPPVTDDMKARQRANMEDQAASGQFTPPEDSDFAKRGGRTKKADGGKLSGENKKLAVRLGGDRKSLGVDKDYGVPKVTTTEDLKTKRASGGRAKGKTNINIVISQPKPDQSMQPPQGVVRPPPPPPPPPQMPPPAAGGPPGAGAMPGGPPGGMPPPGPMPHKRGGKVYRSAKDMDAGSEGGLGRLEKAEIQEHRR
jgi:hypothetical protein